MLGVRKYQEIVNIKWLKRKLASSIACSSIKSHLKAK
jgi:hypothetical protein